MGPPAPPSWIAAPIQLHTSFFSCFFNFLIGAHIKTGAPRLHTTMQAILTFPLVLIRDTFMLMHSIPESLANDAVQTRQCNLDVPSRARSCHFLAPWIAAPIQSSTTAASRQSVAERQCTVGTKCIVLHWSYEREYKQS